MNKKTKIVTTIGPATESPEMMARLIDAGANVFRYNMKHNSHDWHRKFILQAKDVAAQKNVNLGTMIDLQGPELRINTFEKQTVHLQKDETIWLNNLEPDQQTISLPDLNISELLNKGDLVLIDDGFIEMVVVQKDGNRVLLKALDTCDIPTRKGVNLPGKPIDLPSLTADDLEKLNMAAEVKPDFVALSFARTKEDIEILRRELQQRHLDAQIVAKIESQQALDHLDEVIESSDVIMIARGDLGIEVPYEELAYWQKMIVDKSRLAHKPVITATQMLQSMIDNPRPTRAEVTDVTNAILYGTDAIMLSGETTAGKYPIKAVEAMTKIARFNEPHANNLKLDCEVHNSTELIAQAALAMVEKSDKVNFDKIIVFSQTGKTVNVVSSLRPNIQVIAIAVSEEVRRTLSLNYGVLAFAEHFPEGKFDLSKGNIKAFEDLKKINVIKSGEKVLVVHGTFWHKQGATNAVELWDVE